MPEAAGAGPAPSGAPSGSSSGSEGAGQGGGREAAPLDFKTAFERQNRALGETRSGLDKVMQEFNRHKKETAPDLELVHKLKEVFNPRPEAEDPVQAWNDQMDYYIAQGIEAEKRGQPIPLTINTAIGHLKSQIENYQQRQAQEAEMARLKAQVEELSNPDRAVNQTAFQTVDQAVIRGLEQLYGVDEATFETRRALFQATAQRLIPAVQELMQRNPRAWDMMRRNPAELQKMAHEALRAVIPPRAQQMLAQEQLQNTEMPLSELHQAMREARQTIKDPHKLEEVTTQIRQEILQRMYNSGKLRLPGR